MFNTLKAKLAPYLAAIKAALALGVLAAVAGSSWYVRGTIAEAHVSELKLEHTKQQTLAAEQYSKELQAVVDRSNNLQATIEGVSREQRKREEANRRTIAELDAQLVRLRDAKASAARQQERTAAASSGATTGQHSATGTAAGVVPPADWRDALLEEAAVALRELAPALQASHERHTELVRAYEAVRQATASGPDN